MLVYKYGETCDELGYDLIPFAIETYGKFGKAALKHLKILQTMALEEGVRCEAGITPWFARSFVDGATQAIGVALQRSIVRDQLRRAHVRRSQGDACCDEGYSSSGSDSDGGQAAACVRACSRRKGWLLVELGACAPHEFLVISCNLWTHSPFFILWVVVVESNIVLYLVILAADYINAPVFCT